MVATLQTVGFWMSRGTSGAEGSTNTPARMPNRAALKRIVRRWAFYLLLAALLGLLCAIPSNAQTIHRLREHCGHAIRR